jgi:hypothetical protein
MALRYHVWVSVPCFAEGRAGPLGRLVEVLGEDVFFVPCAWGTKKPLVTYVRRPFEATKTKAYGALFEVQEVNVAIHGNFALMCDEQFRNSRLERLN